MRTTARRIPGARTPPYVARPTLFYKGKNARKTATKWQNHNEAEGIGANGVFCRQDRHVPWGHLWCGIRSNYSVTSLPVHKRRFLKLTVANMRCLRTTSVEGLLKVAFSSLNFDLGYDSEIVKRRVQEGKACILVVRHWKMSESKMGRIAGIKEFEMRQFEMKQSGLIRKGIIGVLQV